ncbi:MAG: PKD domain-containing protein [Bacteroidales bacterium]
MRKQYNTYIALIIFLLSLPVIQAQDSDMIKIRKLPFNTRQFNEMTPVLLEKGIVFCSDRRTSGVVNNKTFDDDRLYNIYYAPRKDSLDWGRSEIFSGDLKSLFNQGPFCFSPDGRQIYFTGDIERGKRAFKKGFRNRSGIFIAEKRGREWSEPSAFEYNDPLWNLGHPFISSDGRYLFFSSDMPGGQGGSDLYICEWENGSWSEPSNLGPAINSPAAELYPFFSDAGELFFSSDRVGGMGGLDIYSSRMNNKGWTEPVLMPEPLNSAADDFSFFKGTDLGEGFFASNRDKTDDIYMYSSLLKRKSTCSEMVYDNFCFEFIEANAMRLDSMPFRYEWDFDDGNKASGIRAEHCFEEPGTYLVKLNVVDMITGEVQYNEVNHLLQLEKTEQAFFTAPDTCYAGETISLDASETYLPGWDISEYYWNFDDGTADTGMNVDKTYLSAGSYNIQLIVSAPPDEDGNVRETCVSKDIVVRER